MAEGSWTSQVLCRYFLHGVCREKDRCRYSHDLTSKPNMVCRYYQMGTCTYGDKCRYEHRKHDDRRKMCGEPPPIPKPIILPRETEVSPRTLTLLHKKDQSADSGYGELEDLSSSQEPSTSHAFSKPEHWVKAAEFIPGQPWVASGNPSSSSSSNPCVISGNPSSSSSSSKSLMEAARRGAEFIPGKPLDSSTPLSYSNVTKGSSEGEKEVEPKSLTSELLEAGEMCPYAACGQCWYGENCTYVHGDICDMCGKQVLNPKDDEQRKKHTEECIAEHEKEMEKSFAVQRSLDKVCGICMDIVVEKQPPTEARFGILSNCNHVYCLACIRKWRAAKQFENKIVRACPECRVKSDFVTPSLYWVEDKEEKLQLISGYKTALSEKPCKYFDQGRGECPFNNNCFYRHAYPDGRIASPQPIRPRKRQNADGDLDSVSTLLLWDFLDEHRQRIELDLDDLAEQLEALLLRAHLYDSSSDEDDLSDFEGFL